MSTKDSNILPTAPLPTPPPYATPTSTAESAPSPPLASPCSPTDYSDTTTDALRPHAPRRGSSDLVSGIVKLVHGVGEVIRGKVTEVLDSLDGGAKIGISPSSEAKAHDAEIAQRGLDEVHEGLAAVKRQKSARSLSRERSARSLSREGREFPPKDWERGEKAPATSQPASTTTSTPREITGETYTTRAYSPTSPVARLSGDFGDRARGLFEAVHGAGEAIRGTINAELDEFGDDVLSRESGVYSSENDPRAVKERGVSEFKHGVAKLKGEVV